MIVPDRRDWLSLKFIWPMTSTKAQVEFKKGFTGQFGQEYCSQVHEVLVLLVFSLMADWTRVGSNLCYR